MFEINTVLKCMPKFKLGDRFVKKGTRDTIPLTIVGISFQEFNEPVYKLSKITFSTDPCYIGEEALEEIYRKI